MSKRLICLTFAISLALTTPTFAQGRNDDSDVRLSAGAASPITRVIRALKKAMLDLYEITVPHP